MCRNKTRLLRKQKPFQRLDQKDKQVFNLRFYRYRASDPEMFQNGTLESSKSSMTVPSPPAEPFQKPRKMKDIKSVRSATQGRQKREAKHFAFEEFEEHLASQILAGALVLHILKNSRSPLSTSKASSKCPRTEVTSF